MPGLLNVFTKDTLIEQSNNKVHDASKNPAFKGNIHVKKKDI